MSKPYYITTPIFYVNDTPHIGHAYTSLACDVLARFKRLDGFEVAFLTGTDEHGQKVAKSAAAAGVDPQAFTDKVSQHFRDMGTALGLTNTDFIRTTEPRHKRACQALWNRLVERGEVYLGRYAGWYATSDEAFYQESELTTNAAGKKIAPSGSVCEWMEEPSYFFRLSVWGERLLAFYDAHPDFILPSTRRNEVVSFVKSGLEDLSISRTALTWGVPVPDAPEHVMYVWLDALTNYLTALGYPDENADRFRTFWPADLHLMGKDILRFHAVYWPAFLMAAGLPVPQRIFAHGWWTNEGRKISKSLGNVIDPLELISTYGLDPVRYFLMREVPFGQDGDFSHAAMVRRLNSDLANDLGNLAQRALVLVQRFVEGRVPTPGPLTEADRALLDPAEALLATVREALDAQAFHKALEAVWSVIADANRYVDTQAPWTLRKTDPARLGTVLVALIDVLRRVGIVLQPFMPQTMGRLLDQLGVPVGEARTFAALALSASESLPPGTPLPPPQGLFPRVEEQKAEGRDQGSEG